MQNATIAANPNIAKLRDIIAAYDTIAESERNAHGAKFDGWVKFADIANLVDVAQYEIDALAHWAQAHLTSPTHKVFVWTNRMSAELVS